MLGRRGKEQEGTSPQWESSPIRGGRVSFIAQGTRVLGDCESDGGLLIEGTVVGSVRARRLELAESGSVEGDVLPFPGGSGDEVFVIGGRVGGAVRATDVEVGPKGSVAGTVAADRATIHGRVQGGVGATDRLVLEATAVVEGDVRARRLAIKDGGQVNGDIRMREAAAGEVPGGEPLDAAPAGPAGGPTPRLVRTEDAEGVDAGGLAGGQEGGRERYG